MAKVEITQAAIVHAFRSAGLPTPKYAGFEEGFKLGVKHREEQRLLEASGFATVPVVKVEVIA